MGLIKMHLFTHLLQACELYVGQALLQFSSPPSGICSNWGHGIQKEQHTGAHVVYSLLLVMVNVNITTFF